MARSKVTRDDVYRFVRDRLLAGEPPTVREVQAAMGYAAVESARKQLEALVAEGRLFKLAGRARGYGLPVGHAGEERVVRVPLIHEWATPTLDAAIDGCRHWVVTQSTLPAAELFAMRADEPHEEGGVRAGDVLVARRGPCVDPAALVIRVEAGRPALGAVSGNGRDAAIVGRVVEVRRRLASSASAAGDEMAEQPA